MTSSCVEDVPFFLFVLSIHRDSGKMFEKTLSLLIQALSIYFSVFQRIPCNGVDSCLKGTTTLMITMFYMKDLNKP